MGKRKRRPESLGEIMLDVVPFDARAIELGDYPLFSYRKLMTCPTWGFTWCFMAKHSVSTQPGWMWGFCTLRCLRCTQTELHGIKPQHNKINNYKHEWFAGPYIIGGCGGLLCTLVISCLHLNNLLQPSGARPFHGFLDPCYPLLTFEATVWKVLLVQDSFPWKLDCQNY